MGDVYLAGAEAPKPPPAGPDAKVAGEWATVDKTSVAELETFVRRHGSSAEADYARARIEELNKRLIPPIPKREQPTTTTGMPRCESYLERAACELNVTCSWAANAKCQEKSGGLATALLEALPPSKPAPAPAPPTPPATSEFPKRVYACPADALTLAPIGSGKRCLKAGDSFKDCPECPEMVVVPPGEFTMGSPANEEGRGLLEGPQRKVTIGKPFAVGKFEVTFAEWDACVAGGSCINDPFAGPDDYGWGRGPRPLINVSWDRFRGSISALAVAHARQHLPPAHRGGVGILSSCRLHDALLDRAVNYHR